MSDEETQQSSTEEPTGETQQEESSGEVTPEAIEAYWRKRFSNSDKAHAAEAKVLREQLAAAQGTKAGAPAPEADPQVAETIKRLQDEVLQERTARVIDTRKAKYPAAAEALGDEVIVQMDEARLAGLNETLSLGKAPRMDANNPARKVQGGSKPISEMSYEELLVAFKNTPLPSF